MDTNPGLRNQAGVRAFFRVTGPLVLLGAVVLGIIGFVDFIGSMNSFGPPTRFWMLMVAIPMLAVGGWLTQAGYGGVAARYASGELSPVVKDSAAYLTDGEGLLGVGRTVDDERASGPFCRSCGTRNDGDARFCDGCGTSLA
ncbi:zinc ribbon domain-containing protein [Nocardioides coralli]|uniref:zinc ribbon domain-containing protein n=1 Tax=Nocardioides coralli TaxID=2872154 RepID=UPI001CA3F4F2|nr:zinc ribbon domain-containing protein [Nocardioides coralli]QZY29562.1 zinc ribbon domain-containing protein [Nocardioides coralli]